MDEKSEVERGFPSRAGYGLFLAGEVIRKVRRSVFDVLRAIILNALHEQSSQQSDKFV